MSIARFAIAFSVIVAADQWLRRIESDSDEPRDSTSGTLAATLVWVALLSPLLFSYAS